MVTIHEVRAAEAEVEEARLEGLAHVRAGRLGEGCLNSDSVAGKKFAAAYARWMDLRAQMNDPFALSLCSAGTKKEPK